jgi:hypothetical protein
MAPEHITAEGPFNSQAYKHPRGPGDRSGEDASETLALADFSQQVCSPVRSNGFSGKVVVNSAFMLVQLIEQKERELQE